nr:hypothetical protein [uncultured Methanosphaera sp.]
MSMHSLANQMEYQLKSLIKDTANNNPAPKWAVIKSVSDDHCYANVSIDGGQLNGVECFGYPTVGSKCIIIFMNGDIDNMVALCNPMSMAKYEGTLKPYLNLLENGVFIKFNSDGSFKNWVGGVKSTQYPLHGKYCCEIKPKSSVSCNLIDVSSITKIDDAVIQISMNWKGSEIGVKCYDENNKLLTYVPKGVGLTEQLLPSEDHWCYQQQFINDKIKKLRVEFTNKSDTKSAFIDGIRIYKSDDSYEWYPYDKTEIF